MSDQSERAVERELPIPLQLDRAAADAEALSIPISIASGAVVDDGWLGPVQLSMDPMAVDLSRAAEHGLPVQEMHRRGIPVGRCVNIRIDGDKLRGTLRFSRNARGQELYRDAVDGIITDTSVGASIYAVTEADAGHLIAVRWRPREVSLVDEGADPSVGVNRTAPKPAQPQPQEVKTMPAETLAQPAETTRSAAIQTNDNRNAINIRELGDYGHKRAPDLGIDRMTEDFIAFDKPFEEFRAEVWRMLKEHQDKQPAVGTPPAELGMERKEVEQFSIVRAVRAVLTKDWSKAGLERAASAAIAERLGRDPRGFFVPADVQRQFHSVQRTLSAGDNTAGGYLVGTDHRADQFIDALRARSIAMGMGVRMLGGLVGNVGIPKKTSTASFYWLSESEDATESEPAFGSVLLTPHTMAGAVPMTRRLIMQSSPDVEALVRMDLIDGAALALDEAIFEGTGGKDPLGLVNHPDINTVAVSTDGTPTWAEVVQFESEVATDNALAGSLFYVSTPAVKGKMKTTSKDTGSGLFICSDSNQVNGYELRTSTQLAANTLLFGDFSQIVVGMWGVLDIKPDEATNAASGGVILRVFQDADVAIRHGQAFAIGT